MAARMSTSRTDVPVNAVGLYDGKPNASAADRGGLYDGTSNASANDVVVLYDGKPTQAPHTPMSNKFSAINVYMRGWTCAECNGCVTSRTDVSEHAVGLYDGTPNASTNEVVVLYDGKPTQAPHTPISNKLFDINIYMSVCLEPSPICTMGQPTQECEWKTIGSTLGKPSEHAPCTLERWTNKPGI